MLDLSEVKWSKQSTAAVRKLRATLDSEFEFVPQPLSMLGFRSAITRFLKSERFRLKSKWLKGMKKCPLKVEFEDQWDRLVEYWQTKSQQEKSQQMQVARQSVKSNNQVGRKGKAAKDIPVSRMWASPLCSCFHSRGLSCLVNSIGL
jgi:hypothetical protein